jgi:bifunctional NMN adenylyltransferase/nudix hydrolase
MSKKYDFSVFIGRMQPPHAAHIQNIRQALSIANEVIIIFGSHRAASNIKNPFTAKEREEMVKCCFNKDDQERMHFTSVRDYYYNDNNWVADVQQKVFNITDEGKSIALLGRYKDHSSYYLDLFPQWKREEVVSTNLLMNATDVRNVFFQGLETEVLKTSTSKELLPGVLDYLIYWRNVNKEKYKYLCEEWRFIQDYKAMWASAPYPVTFVTTDAVLVKSGHVLMVRRKANPGRGLLALPGGFLQQNTKIVDSALKELKEETRIRVPKEDLIKSLKDEKVFDHPNRSLRGRTITHAFYFELPAGGELPHVKGDDDAEHAMWIPITELYSRDDEIYEDHCHIIQWFYNRGGSK